MNQSATIVGEGEVVIGRSSQSTLRLLHDHWISRQHFKIVLQNDALFLEDLQSTNGVLLNDRELNGRTVPLQDRDRVQAGETLFLVRSRELEPLPEKKHTLPSSGSVSVWNGEEESMLIGQQSSTNVTGQSVPSIPMFERLPTVKFGESTAMFGLRTAQILQKSRRPIFGLFDAGSDDRIRALVEASGELFRSTSGGELPANSPLVVSFQTGSRLLPAILREGWGKNWGFYLTSSADIDQLRDHFRFLLILRTADGVPHYPSFQQPKMLRELLGVIDSSVAPTFFGPVSRFLVEAENPAKLVSVKFQSGQLQRTEQSLDSQGPSLPGKRPV
ncbi:MAG: DUF4123 domain-containing protein [Planctomycetia bacterium]